MNSALMDFLEHLLSFNLHFTITSAKRSVAENKAAGGFLSAFLPASSCHRY